MTQEALKLALEALDNLMYWDNGKPDYDEAREAITAIKEALTLPDPYKQGYADAMNWKVQNHLEHLPTAQPEQEPVKYSDYEPDGVHHNKPPQRTWVGLTDEEYAELAEEFGPFPINQIEARLKEKNTHEAI